jgi:beta-aspartyl-peptidase (threonine type)
MTDVPAASSSSVSNGSGSSPTQLSGRFSLVCHGGSGHISLDISRPPYVASLLSSLHTGYDLLAAGGSALDAVIAVVSALESHPLYNAGVGSVFNTDGSHELDAAVMEGERRRCGAVAAIRHVEHPIVLARCVMETTSHCLMIGAGAEELARRHQAAYGIKMVSNDFFDVPERWRSLNDWRRQQGLQPLKGEGPGRVEATEQQPAALPPSAADVNSKFGTVGCVAYDQLGNVAAATSTGGLTGKLEGRVGDSPLPGCGVYADNRSAGVSSTGHGEFFIRSVMAKEVADCVRWRRQPGSSVQEVCRQAFADSMDSLGEAALGGVIVIDREGEIGTFHNAAGMFRAFVTQDGIPHAAIFDEEESTEGASWS